MAKEFFWAIFRHLTEKSCIKGRNNCFPEQFSKRKRQNCSEKWQNNYFLGNFLTEKCLVGRFMKEREENRIEKCENELG